MNKKQPHILILMTDEQTSPDSWLYMQAQLDLWYAGQKPTEVEEFGNVALS